MCVDNRSLIFVYTFFTRNDKKNIIMIENDYHLPLGEEAVMFLTGLQIGEKAKITDVSSVHKDVQRRLLDLGIYEGVEICYTCTLPFGGPYILECAGQCVGIRRKEAATILVERL